MAIKGYRNFPSENILKVVKWVKTPIMLKAVRNEKRELTKDFIAKTKVRESFSLSSSRICGNIWLAPIRYNGN